ncbi:MAG: glycosyltransferase family 4 protein [Alistipes finegoldii]
MSGSSATPSRASYGANPMEEVARGAVVAAQVAKELEGQFDVIHAHDWLTYYAGIAAKRVSGKPLVVHMHATGTTVRARTSIRRSTPSERAGMHAADRVIAGVEPHATSSSATATGVPADRVVTVHNAVRFAESSGRSPNGRRG